MGGHINAPINQSINQSDRMLGSASAHLLGRKQGLNGPRTSPSLDLHTSCVHVTGSTRWPPTGQTLGLSGRAMLDHWAGDETSLSPMGRGLIPWFKLAKLGVGPPGSGGLVAGSLPKGREAISSSSRANSRIEEGGILGEGEF